MAFVPQKLLTRLYTYGSLQNTYDGVQFTIKNRLSAAKLTGLQKVVIDEVEVPPENITLNFGDGCHRTTAELSNGAPVEFPLRKEVSVTARIKPLASGSHKITLVVHTSPFGKLEFTVDDVCSGPTVDSSRIPRAMDDDYSPEIIKKRREFIEEFTDQKLEHILHHSFDPHLAIGNIEHFVGVAQVPLGFAGPLQIDGEHAKGKFIIPLATTEGSLVASYNRGMKLLNMCGGVKVTVTGDAMQRAPVFIFKDARGARDFIVWVQSNHARIGREAEATSRVAKLDHIEPYQSNKFAFLRFNFKTGDASGQNMAGRATFAACSWILDNYPGITEFYLESNFATDKKASHVNIMRTRGKRVTAEATIKRDLLIQQMHAEPEKLHYHAGVGDIGAILAGANNNGLQSANAIAALFIATGQDVASVAESSPAIIYTELTPDRDLYLSITLPSLVVATYGGGTGLATQRECLKLMDCWGEGKVNKFAEIVGATVLAGEISLAAAISATEWVSSHEALGRNR